MAADGRNVTVQDRKLADFVNKFAERGEAVIDWRSVREYRYPVNAHPAAMCTVLQAKALLEQAISNPARWTFLQDGPVLKLMYMNMRHTYMVSPVAAIHNGLGLSGDWEIPERHTTVVYGGDRLLFLEPSDESIHQACLRLTDITENQSLPFVTRDPRQEENPRAQGHMQQAVVQVPHPQRKKTRRGGGGSRASTGDETRDEHNNEE